MTSIEIQQSEFLKQIYEIKEVKKKPDTSGILKDVRYYSDEDLGLALGPVGVKLKSFSNEIDLDHPDLPNLFNGELVGCEKGTFSKQALDDLNIYFLTKRSNLGISQTLIKDLCQSVKKNSLYEDFVARPNNHIHVRIVASKEKREYLRSRKFIQTIYQSTDFGVSLRDYCRNNFLYEKEIEEIKEKANHFKDHGLKGMAAEIEKSIQRLNDISARDNHYGFNKIEIYNTVHPLARLMNISMSNDYVARAYPYHQLKSIASKEMESVFLRLESFPEALDKPIFDHYRIVFISPSDQNTSDVDSLKSNIGVFLGEKDGEHFFISYWM
jgi:hypothetical protein